MRTRLTNLGASSDSLAVIDPRRFLASSTDPSEEMEGPKPRRRGERSASTRRIQNTSMTSAMGSPARDTPSALSASATGPRERVHGTAAVEKASHTAKQGEEALLPHSATGCGSEQPLPAARPTDTVTVETPRPISTERARVLERVDADIGKTHNFKGSKDVNIQADATQTAISAIPSVGKLTIDGADELKATTTSGVSNSANAIENAEPNFPLEPILSSWQKFYARRFLHACRARIRDKRAKDLMPDGVGPRSQAAKSPGVTTSTFAIVETAARFLGNSW